MVFLYFSRSAQQNRRGSNSLPGIPRMAEPFAGALPLPLDLTRFALVEAASSSLPAAHSKKNTPSCRMGYSFWSGRRGSNSLPRPWQGRALPDELRPQTQDRLYLSSQRLSTPFSQFPQKSHARPCGRACRHLSHDDLHHAGIVGVGIEVRRPAAAAHGSLHLRHRLPHLIGLPFEGAQLHHQ